MSSVYPTTDAHWHPCPPPGDLTVVARSDCGGYRKARESTLATPVGKSVLTIAAPRRYRNREHLRAIKQPCLVCGRKPSDPHYLRFAQPKALGREAIDEFTVPLCRMHHREVHCAGDKRAWWKAAGIDPLKVAGKLWKEARVNEGRIPPSVPPQSGDRGQISVNRLPF
jgi:hypothetical protein